MASRNSVYLVRGFSFSTENLDIPPPYQDPNPIHCCSGDFRRWLGWNLFPQFSKSLLNSKSMRSSEITWEQVATEMWVKQSKVMLFIAFHYTRTSTVVWKTKWKTWQIWKSKIPPAACNKGFSSIKESWDHYKLQVQSPMDCFLSWRTSEKMTCTLNRCRLCKYINSYNQVS